MNEDEDSGESPREQSVRHWTPRVVATVIGLALLTSGIWSNGRELVAFLANWSTFCLQAGAIYLFIFHREFLANFVLDILDYVQRVRDWRARRAEEQRAAREEADRRRAAKRSAAQQAPPDSSEDKPGPPLSAAQTQAPVPTQQQAPPVSPVTRPIESADNRPRFSSRNRALWPRVLIGLAFVAIAAAIFANPFAEKSPTVEPEHEASLPSADATEAEVKPKPEPLQPWTYTVRKGDSCMALGERVHPKDPSAALLLCKKLQVLNSDVQLEPERSEIDPGDTLEIPGEVSKASLE